MGENLLGISETNPNSQAMSSRREEAYYYYVAYRTFRIQQTLSSRPVQLLGLDKQQFFRRRNLDKVYFEQ